MNSTVTGCQSEWSVETNGGSERLDKVRRIRQHEAGMANLKDHLGGLVGH